MLNYTKELLALCNYDLERCKLCPHRRLTRLVRPTQCKIHFGECFCRALVFFFLSTKHITIIINIRALNKKLFQVTTVANEKNTGVGKCIVNTMCSCGSGEIYGKCIFKDYVLRR